MAGADFLLIATNTMHKVAADVGAHVTIPLLHIADATAAVLQQAQVRRIGLLGTAFTMEQAFYRERLEAQGIEVLIPNAEHTSVPLYDTTLIHVEAAVNQALRD